MISLILLLVADILFFVAAFLGRSIVLAGVAIAFLAIYVLPHLSL